MKQDIETILRREKTTKSKHDNMITTISSIIEISPNVIVMYQNAYFKQKTKKRLWEGDIDLLALQYQHENYKDIFHWNEIPFEQSRLLLWEMKTNDTKVNYQKALKQLKKEKDFLKLFTAYQNIDCFYCFGIGNSLSWRYEKVD